MENEKEFDTLESVQEEESVVEETDNSTNEPTLEDYEALASEKAELEKKLEKAEGAIVKTKMAIKAQPKQELKKTEQSGLTREEVILYAKGYTDDEVNTALKLAALNGENPLVVAESDDYFKAKVAERKKKEKSEQASLPASSGLGRVKADKPIGDMDRDEHEEYFKKVMRNV